MLLRKLDSSITLKHSFNITLNSPAKLSYLAWCLIYCPKHEFDKHAQGYSIFFVKEVV